MICTIYMSDTSRKRIIKVGYVGVLHNRPSELYILSGKGENTKETFIPLSNIAAYDVRESR